MSILPAIKFNGLYRPLGLLPDTENEKFGTFARFSSTFVGAVDELQEIDLLDVTGSYPILDQGRSSACVAFACSSGYGRTRIKLFNDLNIYSPFFLYSLINGGRDEGSTLTKGMLAMQQVGLCDEANAPKNVMYKNQFPQSCFDEAKDNRLLSAYRCDDFDEVCHAVSHGYFVPLGIFVDDSFANVDRNGICGVPRSNKGGGHAILGAGLKKIGSYGWCVKIVNSWGRAFGNNGTAFIHKKHFNYMQLDAFAVQTISVKEVNFPEIK